MATPVWITGFEHGVVSANGGGLFTAVSGVPTINSTTKRSGNYALEVNPTGAGAVNGRRNMSASNQIAVIRGYLYIPTGGTPSATASVFGWQITTAAVSVGLTITNAGVMRGIVGGGSAITGPTLTEGQWYKVDLRANITGTTWTLDWRIDDVAQTQAVWAGQATTDSLQYIRLGSASTTISMRAIFDDIVMSETSADYPIAAGSTELIKPTADGTHNSGTNVMENQAGTDLGTAWSLIDDVPMSTATEYIRQAANGAGNYAEVLFGDLVAASSSIFGAMAILAYTSETTSANTGGTIFSKDSFSTQTNVHGSDSAPADMSDGSTSDIYYKSAILANVTNLTTVNALKARFGFSTDATPDPYWVNLGVEVAYVPSTTITGNPGIASETDTAFSVSRSKRRGTGLASTTNTAHALQTARKTKAVGLTSETDTAFSVGKAHRSSAGIASATETALPLGTSRKTKEIAQAISTESALPITAVKVVSVGQAIDTESALSLQVAVKTKSIAQAVETETSFAIGKAHLRTLGQPSDTESSFSITSKKTLIVGLAEETDTAFAVDSTAAVELGFGLETDTALSVGKRKVKEVGQSAPTVETALPIVGMKIKAIGLAAETSTALQAVAVHSKPIGIAVESDSVFSLSSRKILSVGVASEVDTAFSMNPFREVFRSVRTIHGTQNRAQYKTEDPGVYDTENRKADLL